MVGDCDQGRAQLSLSAIVSSVRWHTRSLLSAPKAPGGNNLVSTEGGAVARRARFAGNGPALAKKRNAAAAAQGSRKPRLFPPGALVSYQCDDAQTTCITVVGQYRAVHTAPCLVVRVPITSANRDALLPVASRRR